MLAKSSPASRFFSVGGHALSKLTRAPQHPDISRSDHPEIVCIISPVHMISEWSQQLQAGWRGRSSCSAYRLGEAHTLRSRPTDPTGPNLKFQARGAAPVPHHNRCGHRPHITGQVLLSKAIEPAIPRPVKHGLLPAKVLASQGRGIDELCLPWGSPRPVFSVGGPALRPPNTYLLSYRSFFPLHVSSVVFDLYLPYWSSSSYGNSSTSRS